MHGTFRTGNPLNRTEELDQPSYSTAMSMDTSNHYHSHSRIYGLSSYGRGWVLVGPHHVQRAVLKLVSQIDASSRTTRTLYLPPTIRSTILSSSPNQPGCICCRTCCWRCETPRRTPLFTPFTTIPIWTGSNGLQFSWSALTLLECSRLPHISIHSRSLIACV